MKMKKWLKWTLGIAGLGAVVLAGLVASQWSSLRILMGAGGVSGNQAAIPEKASRVEPASAAEHDWLAWRGARNDARSTWPGVRKDWTGGLKKTWEVDYLCRSGNTASWSAPVIRGNRLIVTGRDEGRDLVFALDPASGSLLWEGSYEAPARNSHGAGARATPFIDDSRVYTYGRSGDLVCWNLEDGSVIWHVSVKEAGGAEPEWGLSSSPLLLGDRVFVQGGGQARTIALNKTSGEVLWKSGTGPAGYAAFATMEVEGETRLIVFHAKGLAGLDPSTGEILWDLPWETPWDVNATTPVVAGDRVFITSGYGRGAQLVRVSSRGAEPLWTTTVLSSHHSDPFIVDERIYGYSGDSTQNRGAFKCLDLATGKEQWSSNEIGWGTCTWIDGHLLCIDIRGNLYLVRPDPSRLVKVAEFRRALGAISGPVWTVPVVANGRLYLRFKERLLSYDLESGPRS